MKKGLKIARNVSLFLLFEIIYIPLLAVLLIFYTPYFTNTKEMIVTTAMTTMTHQYFATWFLSEDEINEILAKNRPSENLEDQVVEDIVVNSNADDGIELVDVSSSSFKGYLLIINDPSRVKLASAPNLGVVGSTTSQIVEYYDAVAGINASGFADDALGTGGKVAGLVMQDGKVVNELSNSYGSVVGITEDNVLVVSNSFTMSNLQKLKVRDAAEFGPVIIINGQPTITSGNGGYGIQPRTAIAQRQDGAVLFLVIDGRQKDSVGATLKNVQDILLQYGAYNAFNLDGGASSTMVYNGEVINNPSDMLGERYVPNAFIVTKAK